ncbi:MAG: hypothetical protein MZW92_52855 [Comamonadaceae bacterium]|nr:hypothetical protein [Comamonadaceae bacterium]
MIGDARVLRSTSPPSTSSTTPTASRCSPHSPRRSAAAAAVAPARRRVRPAAGRRADVARRNGPALARRPSTASDARGRQWSRSMPGATVRSGVARRRPAREDPGLRRGRGHLRQQQHHRSPRSRAGTSTPWPCEGPGRRARCSRAIASWAARSMPSHLDGPPRWRAAVHAPDRPRARLLAAATPTCTRAGRGPLGWRGANVVTDRMIDMVDARANVARSITQLLLQAGRAAARRGAARRPAASVRVEVYPLAPRRAAGH